MNQIYSLLFPSYVPATSGGSLCDPGHPWIYPQFPNGDFCCDKEPCILQMRFHKLLSLAGPISMDSSDYMLPLSFKFTPGYVGRVYHTNNVLKLFHPRQCLGVGKYMHNKYTWTYFYMYKYQRILLCIHCKSIYFHPVHGWWDCMCMALVRSLISYNNGMEIQ